MAEEQPVGPERTEQRERVQRDVEIEVRRRCGGSQVTGLREVDAGRVAYVQVAAGRVEQADVMLGVPG